MASEANLHNLDELFVTSYGVPLPDDAPGDDRTDFALMARENPYRQADALQELFDSAEPVTPLNAPPKPVGWAPEGLGLALMDAAGLGLVEGPRQAIGGMRDTVESVIQLGDMLNELIPFGAHGSSTKKEASTRRYSLLPYMQGLGVAV